MRLALARFRQLHFANDPMPPASASFGEGSWLAGSWNVCHHLSDGLSPPMPACMERGAIGVKYIGEAEPQGMAIVCGRCLVRIDNEIRTIVVELGRLTETERESKSPETKAIMARYVDALGKLEAYLYAKSPRTELELPTWSEVHELHRLVEQEVRTWPAEELGPTAAQVAASDLGYGFEAYPMQVTRVETGPTRPMIVAIEVSAKPAGVSPNVSVMSPALAARDDNAGTDGPPVPVHVKREDTPPARPPRRRRKK